MANTQDDKEPVDPGKLAQPGPDAEPTPAAQDDTPPEPRDLADTIDEATAAWEEPKPAAAPPKPAKPAPAPQARGGFLVPLFGGVLAAGLGYAAANVIKPEGWPFPGAVAGVGPEVRSALAASDARLAETQAQVAELQVRIAALAETDNAPAQDFSPQIAALSADMAALSGQAADLGDRLAALDTRVEELAKAQLAVVTEEAAAALSAYEREIAAMRDELFSQRDQNARLAESVAAVANQAEAEIDAAIGRAVQIEARAALMRIDAALANGAPFDTALGQFGGIDLPEGLTRVADRGVPTLAALQRDFPHAARAALDAALPVEAGASAGDRFNAFLRSQLGLRSLAPRAGGDADAVLSRAEAALRDGDLRATLAELDALPEPAMAQMAGWIAAATNRADAVEATRALERSLNQ
ncbi:COG4223 family protein [Rhodovulum strictum]|uniref:Inner membrane protein n=1 Tax=Rhodovulum strictum TaxID=58314 RepID=A0A844BIT1_9RHOB|nr:mitofilin family membrane protein [Rhodovulum strictum]MRH19917.1 hypothetical protein [Rhodovulum strictum]